MSNSASGLRQDRTRAVGGAPQATLGDFGLVATDPQWPCRLEAKETPRGEVIKGAVYADGVAGSPPSTRSTVGWTFALDVDMRNYTGGVPFPPWVKTLLACGFEASHASTTLTLTPSTKPPAAWSSETAGARSPLQLDLADVRRDNATGDSLTKIGGCTGNAVIRLSQSEGCRILAALKGVMVDDVLVDTAGGTFASWLDTTPTGQGAGPIVFAGASSTEGWSCTAAFVDVADGGNSASTALVQLKDFEIDMGADVPDVADPFSVGGLGASPVMFNGPVKVKASFADITTNELELMTAFQKQQRALSLVLTWSDGTRQIIITIPRIQAASANRSTGDGGSRMFDLEGEAVRAALANTTAPISIQWKYS